MTQTFVLHGMTSFISNCINFFLIGAHFVARSNQNRRYISNIVKHGISMTTAFSFTFIATYKLKD